MKKTITILCVFLLLQIAALAQTVYYSYDANGNREHRWIVQPIAPPQNNLITNNSNSVEADIKSLCLSQNNNDKKMSEGDIRLFPNPVKQILNLQFTGNSSSEGCSLLLYDGTAKLFYSTVSLSNLTAIDMQEIKAGSFFAVLVTKEGKRLFWKMVKQ
ncbi:MAG: hypothetical protein NTZ33_11210 [Bacteroidetes bacterium]|nr:hypothetical protein [Bacteroidota bacterium]